VRPEGLRQWKFLTAPLGIQQRPSCFWCGDQLRYGLIKFKQENICFRATKTYISVVKCTTNDKGSSGVLLMLSKFNPDMFR
jgi:hypothetical protein